MAPVAVGSVRRYDQALPVQGFELRERTTYALLVTTSIPVPSSSTLLVKAGELIRVTVAVRAVVARMPGFRSCRM